MSQWAEVHQPCPCGKSSDAYAIDATDGHGKCFSCGKYFPANNKNKQEDELGEPTTSASNENFTYEYLARRGISKETHEFFGVKTQIDSQGMPHSVAYPHPAGYHQLRFLKEKAFRFIGENRSTPGGFCSNLFPAGSAKAITITEGFDDAMSVWQMLGKYPVYSIKGASSALSDVRADYEYLNSFEKIYLALDDDEPGRKASKQIASVFGGGKVYVVSLSPLKDPHEYLEQKREKEFKNLWFNAKRYMPEYILSSFADIRTELLKRKDEVIYEWPFPTLHNMTGGIKQHRQYTITGLEGTGKTEILHEVIHHMLKTYPDLNIGILHLEEPLLDTVTIQVGKELKKPLYLSEHTMDPGKLADEYEKLVGRDDRVHFFHHFGSEDTDTITGAIRFLVAACKCGLVVFDNFQHAVTGRTKDRDTEALDYLANRLESLVKELPFALIDISHENDNELARGSRNITKECDVWINVKRDIGHENDFTRNIQYLTIKKGRGCRKTGPAGKLHYNQDTATLSELTDELPS